MELKEVMAALKAAGNDKVKKLEVRKGAGDNQFGVQSGDIRTLAKKLKGKSELAAMLLEDRQCGRDASRGTADESQADHACGT